MSKLLLSQHSSHPNLSPQDLNQWYQSGYTLHQNKVLKHDAGSNIYSNHQPPFGTIRIHFRTIHYKHHSWSTGTTGFFFHPQIFIHHYKDKYTWIHYIYTWIRYIHCSATFSTNFQGVLFFYPQIFVHHYKENHTWIDYIYTWIHYIHWYAKFSTNLQGVHAAHKGSTTSSFAGCPCCPQRVSMLCIEKYLCYKSNFKTFKCQAYPY
jgi:hypothetical protein